MKTTKPTLLVVDDTPINLDILRNILSPLYDVKLAINGEVALKVAQKTQPDLILLDIMMPGMNGYEVCEKLKQDPRTAHIPVIFVTAMSDVEDEAKGFETGAVDYITKPVSPSIVLARVKTHLSLHNQQLALESQVSQRTHDLVEAQFEILRCLGRAAEYKDNDTAQHVIRVSHYARILALHAGVNENEADLIFSAMPMHDIGKIGVPDQVLLKPGSLDVTEWDVMRAHCEVGASILGSSDSTIIRYSREIALTHQEKWNGTGYPLGLKGEEIPFTGRLAAIADVLDALTTKRPYKRAWSFDEAVACIQKDAGVHFDPGLMPAFKKALPELEAVYLHFQDPSWFSEEKQAEGVTP